MGLFALVSNEAGNVQFVSSSGAFKAFCHSKSSQLGSRKGGSHQEGASGSNRHLHLSPYDASDIKTTGSQSPSSSGPILGTAILDHQGFTSKFKLKAEVDSGFHCMVVTFSIVDQAFPNNVLHDLHCPNSEFRWLQNRFHRGHLPNQCPFQWQ